MPATPVPVPGWPGGEGRQRTGGTGSPLRLTPGRSFALLCVAGSGCRDPAAALVLDDGNRLPLGEPGAGRERLIELART